MVTFLSLCLIRIVIFVKMRGSVGQECALNAMLVCAGHIFTSHGECCMYPGGTPIWNRRGWLLEI